MAGYFAYRSTEAYLLDKVRKYAVPRETAPRRPTNNSFRRIGSKVLHNAAGLWSTNRHHCIGLDVAIRGVLGGHCRDTAFRCNGADTVDASNQPVKTCLNMPNSEQSQQDAENCQKLLPCKAVTSRMLAPTRLLPVGYDWFHPVLHFFGNGPCVIAIPLH